MKKILIITCLLFFLFFALSEISARINHESNKYSVFDRNVFFKGGAFTVEEIMPFRFKFRGEDLSNKVVNRLNEVRLVTTIFTLIIGAVLIHFFPKFFQKTSENISKKPGVCLGYGALFFLLIPIAFITLFLTIIGIPLAIFLLVIYVIFLYLVRIVTIFWLGIYISEKLESRKIDLLAYVLGVVSYYLIQYIPYLANVMLLFTILFGMGAVYLSWQKPAKAEKKSK